MKLHPGHDDIQVRMVLVRHGQSVANAQRIFEGHNDSQLTKLGRTQARTLAEWLKTAGYNFDQIYSSDLGRASETAQIIVTHLETRTGPVICTPLLRELDLGTLAGKPRDNLRPDEQAIFETFWNEREKQIPGGESINLLLRRLEEFMRMVEKLQTFITSILIVTHGGPIHHILSDILGLQDGTSFNLIENCQMMEVARVKTPPKPPEWKLLTVTPKPKSS